MICKEFVTVLVRDPRTQKEDSWHSYIDYEIFIHCPGTAGMRAGCSQLLGQELCIHLQAAARDGYWQQKMTAYGAFHFAALSPGLGKEANSVVKIVQDTLLLSDSRLHLFLQTQLSPEDMEACVSGQTKYSVADAIHQFASLNRRFPIEDEERKKGKNDAGSDSER
ncbi:Sorting nexin-10 [Pitangus sulphuratus]|nr:Sorting nexin-10 [Pitangus sulphuratus]